MQIVQHCTPFSFTISPPYPLLPAPPKRLCLPAPKITGLLPARCPRVAVPVSVSESDVESHEPLSDAWWDAIYARHGLKSREEMDADLICLMTQIRAEREFLRQKRAVIS